MKVLHELEPMLFTEFKNLYSLQRYLPSKWPWFSVIFKVNRGEIWGNPGKWPKIFPSNYIRASPVCSISMKFGMRVAFWEGNKTCFLDFWYLARFWLLLRNFGPNCTRLCNNGQIRENRAEYWKSKKQVLFSSQNATLMPNFREIKPTCEALI